MKNDKYIKVSDVQDKTHKVLQTGVKEIDYIYGTNGKSFGIPEKSISIIYGESGVGKSRLIVYMIGEILKNNIKNKVLYFQIESDINSFVSHHKLKKLENQDNLFLSDKKDLNSIIDISKEIKPSIVIIDSINQIREFKGGRGAKDVIDGNEELEGLSSVAQKNDIIFLLIAQENQNGKAKGGTEFIHLADILFHVNRKEEKIDDPYNMAEYFRMKAIENGRDPDAEKDKKFYMESIKNRYYKNGIRIKFYNGNCGATIDKNSMARLDDQKYIDITHEGGRIYNRNKQSKISREENNKKCFEDFKTKVKQIKGEGPFDPTNPSPIDMATTYEELNKINNMSLFKYFVYDIRKNIFKKNK